MDDDILAALNSFKSSLDQMRSALGKHLNLNIIRDHVFIDKFSQKIIFDLGSRRKTYFDLLKAQLHKQIEEFHLLLNNHRLDKCLIAVAQVNTAPDRRLLYLFVRPLTFRVIHHRYAFVFLIIQHFPSSLYCNNVL